MERVNRNSGVGAGLVVAVGLTFAAGCGEGPAAPTATDPSAARRAAASTPSGYVTQGRTLQGRTLQGRTLQGRTLQGTALAGVTVAGAAVTGLTLEGTAFVGTVNGQVLRGQDFVGAVFQEVAEGGAAAELLVQDIAPDPADPSGATLLYQLLSRDPVTGAAGGACQADTSGDARALPLAGTWDESGAFHDSASTFSFACVKGVLAKCARWGYKPWQALAGRSLREYHQACTRMARADYCGDGVPHTVDGNLIEFGDSLGLHHLNASASGWRREATWAPEGARCIDQPRLATTTLAAIERECPGRVRTTGPAESPLLAADGAAPPGRCDPDAEGTLLINLTRQTADSAGMR